MKNFHTYITLPLSILVTGLVSAAACAGQDQVAILLRDQTHAALESPLNQYIRDVEERFPVKSQVIKRDWKTAEEIRAAIKILHAEKHISGVIPEGFKILARGRGAPSKNTPELLVSITRTERSRPGCVGRRSPRVPVGDPGFISLADSRPNRRDARLP